ncbi:MAG: hypothetical protein A3C70_00475 [Candidatus Zambryskibacteria bacterium RIFCSPHIGHO2_02_FULL_43_14]|uniref:Ada DNA repair metal-binding domain-containing protein n=1 Tax=Candidatus Zambryskibacteria bacterium RIFCSPHIGHO2_02_FULL_43_14 TaxID=1802748 RepID=A0A1G2THM3_9BACT|nr:MAG: hypothetical protein A2829_02050 [Candidatus Zambryskibacteria bacterium RIFCSPHIGHO2_01_FULL_43_60]OHA96814.1 MAG: hypothetical protein A3C70_00475 [Candidatus Zambryskibacteria bacterium RIFCSPHIGHO2_02_FULL_43_14]OHB04070.1 MAG: hypothetical protein A3B03_01300 [Candidatus Zambryskibacteria bacterium RIFCSPLOWO2_01_FULL_42_41]
MNIAETVSYDKDGHIERFPLFRKLFLSLVIILVALLSFGIGQLSVTGDREPIKIEYDQSLTEQTATVVNAVQAVPAPRNSIQQSEVVVSKNSTKYHYSHCSGAKQIKEENKIIFATPTAAEAAGYTLAANCKPK